MPHDLLTFDLHGRGSRKQLARAWECCWCYAAMSSGASSDDLAVQATNDDATSCKRYWIALLAYKSPLFNLIYYLTLHQLPNHAGLQFRRATGRMISSNISADLLIESRQRLTEVNKQKIYLYRFLPLENEESFQTGR